MAQLEFDSDKHEYRVDGVVVPSVTDLVSIYGQDMDADYEDRMDAAADRGTTCHKVLEMLLNGETDIEYPSTYEPFVTAIYALLSEHEITPVALETPICSEKMRVAGTPDCLCYFDSVLTLLDYKFVSQIAKTKVKAQLNGYNLMYNEQGVFPEQLKAIQFLNTGKPRIYDVAIDDHEFLVCLEIHNLKNKKHPRGRIE